MRHPKYDIVPLRHPLRIQEDPDSWTESLEPLSSCTAINLFFINRPQWRRSEEIIDAEQLPLIMQANEEEYPNGQV